MAEAIRLAVEALRSSGNYHIEIFTLLDDGFDEAKRSFDGVKIHAYRRIGPRRYGFSFGLTFGLLRSNVDLLHVHGVWTFHCLASLIWHLWTRKPYVVTPHGMLEPWILNRSPVTKRCVSLLYQNTFLRRAAAVQVLTEKEREDVASFCVNRTTDIIPNCVSSLPVGTSRPKPKWWRSGLSDRLIFLFLGRIHDKKGCMELCDAWEHLCRNNPLFADRSYMVFCGWNDGLDAFESRVAGLTQMLGNVVFTGPQFGADKLDAFEAASFMILPSKSEGLPLTVLEAWNCGTPVIMTKECNLGIGFQTGAALEIGTSVASIEEGLRAASDMSDEKRLAMSESAHRLVAEEFSTKVIGEKLSSMYQRLWAR